MSGFLNNASYLSDGFAGNYLPEMQGMTDIMQRQFQNRMNQQMGGYTRQAGRSNLQSSGGYLAGRSQMGAGGAQGMQDIATQNMYKNAVYAMEDRRRKEQMSFQKEMARDAWRRQMETYNLQQQQSQQNALWGGLGGIASMFLNPLLGGAAQGVMDAINPSQKNLTTAMTNYYMQMLNPTNPTNPTTDNVKP